MILVSYEIPIGALTELRDVKTGDTFCCLECNNKINTYQHYLRGQSWAHRWATGGRVYVSAMNLLNGEIIHIPEDSKVVRTVITTRSCDEIP